jgi:hypothetical protein
MRPGTSARDEVAPIIRNEITASAMNMYTAELVSAISALPIFRT